MNIGKWEKPSVFLKEYFGFKTGYAILKVRLNDVVKKTQIVIFQITAINI